MPFVSFSPPSPFPGKIQPGDNSAKNMFASFRLSHLYTFRWTQIRRQQKTVNLLFPINSINGFSILTADLLLLYSCKTFYLIIGVLVGFGRACAPVRCAHPSFWAHKHAKRALRAPRPSQLRCSSQN